MKSVSIQIRHAVFLALAPACGQAATLIDAGSDATSPPVDATVAETSTADGSADDVTDASAYYPDVPVPDGCILSGRPDGFAPCGFTELLNDPTLCQVDVNADGGTQDSGLCYALCDWGEPDCYYFSAGEAGDYLTCGAGCVGRLPEGERAALRGRCEPLGGTDADTLANAAYLEAASIDAFDVLAGELRAYRAPARLVTAARRAARDETRHARIVGRLARAYGSSARRPRRSEKRAPRPLAEIALENAIEGCVRETYGAAVALFQAEHARDERVRDAMRSIAEDELEHASLGWKIHAWACARLTPEARARVLAAHERAIGELGASLASSARASTALGMPDATQARKLYDALRESLWAA